MVDKENMVPLRMSGRTEGHDADLQVKQVLMKEQDDLKYEIGTYRGTDPLQPYYNYVMWLEKNSTDDIIPVLEDILVKFKEIPAYKQDPRLVYILIEYISAQPNPAEVYRIVHDQGLGTMRSIFYIRWAQEIEKMNDFYTADQVFQLGMKCKAQPENDLQNAHLQFQLSIARRVLEGGIDIGRREIHPFARTATAFNMHSTQIPNRDRISSDIRKGEFEKFDEVDGRQNCVDLLDVERRNKVIPKQLYPMHLQVHEGFKKVERPSRKSEFKCPIAIFEPPDPLKKAHYPKHLVYVDGRDIQLEEIRAAERTRKESVQQTAEPMNLTKSSNTRRIVTQSLLPSQHDPVSNPSFDQNPCLRTDFIQPVEKPLESKLSNTSPEENLRLKTDFIQPVKKPLVVPHNAKPLGNDRYVTLRSEEFLPRPLVESNLPQVLSRPPPNSDFLNSDQSWCLRTDFIEPAKLIQLSEPPTAQNFGSESHSSTEPTFLKRKSEVQGLTQEVERDKPQRPNEEDVFDFSGHSSKGSTSALHHSPTASFTVNTRAAMNLIQKMWESPLAPRSVKVSKTTAEDDFFKVPVARKSEYCLMADEEDRVSSLATAEERGTDVLPKAGNVPAFAVYCEEDTNPLKDVYARLSSRSNSHRAIPIEDRFSTSMNPLEVYEERKCETNVVPSLIPLPLACQQLENKENVLEKVPVPRADENDENEKNMFDDTCSTRAFQILLPSSTPFSRPDRSRRGRVSSVFNGSYLDEDERPIGACPQPYLTTMNSTKNPTNLSLILENSKEHGSSSGGMAPKSFC